MEVITIDFGNGTVIKCGGIVFAAIDVIETVGMGEYDEGVCAVGVYGKFSITQMYTAEYAIKEEIQNITKKMIKEVGLMEGLQTTQEIKDLLKSLMEREVQDAQRKQDTN